MKLSDLKIRDKISCRISGGSGNVYHLRVEDTIGNKFLLTDLPIVSTRKIKFNIGSVFDFLYTDSTGIYFFKGKIVPEKDPEVMRISLLEAEFNQIQRRSFFRLPLDLHCGIISFDEFYKEEIKYNSVDVINISATSIRILSTKNLNYKENQLLYVKSDFFKDFFGGLWGKVFKIDRNETEDSYSEVNYIIKFIHLTNNEIEDIVKLIFKKQREIIKNNYEI